MFLSHYTFVTSTSLTYPTIHLISFNHLPAMPGRLAKPPVIAFDTRYFPAFYKFRVHDAPAISTDKNSGFQRCPTEERKIIIGNGAAIRNNCQALQPKRAVQTVPYGDIAN